MKFTVILKKDDKDSALVAYMKKYWCRRYDKVLREWDEQGYATIDLELLRDLAYGFGHRELCDEVSIYAGDSSVGRQLHYNDILSLLHSKKKDVVDDDEDIYLHESKNSLFERVLNEIWDNPRDYDIPREPTYAVKPSEREVWLNSKFDPNLVVEFNGEIVYVMPISKDILLIRDGSAAADNFVYNIETEFFLGRIRSRASHAINENIFGSRSNFYLNVYTPAHNHVSQAQWDMRWDDSGTTLSVCSNTGVKKNFSSTDEDIDEALDFCAGKWEETLSKLFKDAIPETIDDSLRKEFLKESRHYSRKNKLKESELPTELIKMSKDDGGFVGQNVEGMVEDGCEDPVDMILENEVDAYLYDSYVSNKYPEYEKEYKLAVYDSAYSYLADRGLI